MIVTTGGRAARSSSASSYDLGLGVVVGGVLDHDLAVDLGCDQDDRLVAQRLRDRDHLAEAHHDLDDLGDGDPERGGQVLDADAGRDGDRPGGRRQSAAAAAARSSRRCGRAPGARRGRASCRRR